MPTPSSHPLASQELYLYNPIGFSADRERQARKFDRMIEHTGMDEALSTYESRLSFVDNLSSEDFVHLLREMDGIFLNLPASQRNLSNELQTSKAPDSALPMDIHPAKEDKESLLSEVLSTAQAAPQLEDKAMILAVGINAVHPFAEGNGRIARATYYLLMNGYKKGDQKLQAILGEEGEKIITPDPNMLRPPIMGNMQLQVGTHILDDQQLRTVPKLQVSITNPDFNPFSSGQDESRPNNRRNEIAGILLQEDFGTMIPILALSYLDSDAVRNSIVENGGRSFFAIDLFYDQASDEDFDNFYEVFRELKNAYVRELLRQLSLGEKSDQMYAPNDAGQLELWPMATLMKAVTSGETDMSVDKFDNI